MNLIELHILQSFPPTCLNRDRFGAPKSAMFGGVERARVSSQCWKRPTRELAHEMMPNIFGACRSKILGPAIEKAAKELGADEILVSQVKEIVLSALGKDGNHDGWVNTLFFFSPESMKNAVRHLIESDKRDAFASVVAMLGSSDKKKAEKAKKEAKSIASGFLASFSKNVTDAADIALFGRMVADDPSQTVEGAAMFSHALSTHVVRNELDFFSAVDDEKNVSDDSDDAGAGHLGDVEYNSACYYRYIGINLDLLDPAKGKNNCNLFDAAQRRVILETFIKVAVLAVPSARKNSMAGHTWPSYVLAVKRSGQPLSLANAFESPVQAKKGGGYIVPSIAALKKEWTDLKAAFGIDGGVECEIEKGKEGTESLANVLTKLLTDI